MGPIAGLIEEGIIVSAERGRQARISIRRRICMRCLGQGSFTGARPKDAPPEPDYPCGQCDGLGHVYVQVV